MPASKGGARYRREGVEAVVNGEAHTGIEEAGKVVA